jgi:hypothetical protein
VSPYDAGDNRQAEPDAFGLRNEQWLEDLVGDFARHTRPVVGHADAPRSVATPVGRNHDASGGRPILASRLHRVLDEIDEQSVEQLTTARPSPTR